MNTPETLRRAARAIDDYEGCARMYDRGTEESLDLYELADAWEADRKRLEEAKPFVEAAAEMAETGVVWADRAQAWLDALAGEKP